MGVIPIRAGLLRDETVGELTSDRHCVLGHTRDPVHGVRHINARASAA